MLPSSSIRDHGGHALLAVLLACALMTSTHAQDGDASAGSNQDQVSTAMVALLAAVIAVFGFIAASTIYLRHCSGHAVSSPPPPAGVAAGSLDSFFASRSWWQRRRGRGGRDSRGLDVEVVEAFPTMTYAEAKALRVGTAKGGEGALECAVCLSEFEDEEQLRLLLPKCCHAFHPDCIAQWLAGHVTCPVCRCNLQPCDDKDTTSASYVGEPTIPLASSVSSDTAAALQGAAGVRLPVAVVIDVVTEEKEERRQEALELHRIGTQRRTVSGRRPAAAAEIAARLDRDLERFTLRLPENVRRELVAAAAAECSSRLRRARRRRRGEGGGGARSEPLVVGRMGSRWQSLLAGNFSGRLTLFSASRVTVGSDGGEVSSSSLYSYARLRGKRVAAVDAAADVPDEESVRLDSIGGVGGSGGAGGKASNGVVAAAADEEMGVKEQCRT
ncbi:unnamed protein product [Urochloa humidicola]